MVAFLRAVCIFLILSIQAPYTLYAVEDFLPAAPIKDISGRAYEPAVIELLDGAKESIVIAMYSISLGTKNRNPVRLLLNDLIEARERGVSVDMYLNTKFKGVSKESMRLVHNPELEGLKKAGCKIHLVPPGRRLHHKLIIVDGRYVVEGSTNWSLSALKNNYEVNSLIDSPELAKARLLRLKFIPLTVKPKVKPPGTPAYIENLPEEITLSRALVLDKKYFPAMVTRKDNYSFNLYLMLLAHSRAENKKEFFLELGSMGLSLGMPDSQSDVDLRRQVIRTLRKLKKRYNLIDVKFSHGRDAWIELADIPGEAFTVSSRLIWPDSGENYPPRVKFYLMAEALYGVQHEMALTLCDVLIRRTHVIYETRDGGGEQARAVAELMAPRLGWDGAEIERQVAAYVAQVALTQQWRILP